MALQFEEKYRCGIKVKEFQVHKIGTRKTGKGKKGTTQRKTGGYIINLKISSKTKGPSNRYMLGIKYIEEKRYKSLDNQVKKVQVKKVQSNFYFLY